MAMEITQILLAAQSPDAQIRTAAEESLKQFQEQNLPHFLLALSVELSNEQKPPASRRLAGIILKNSLDAKDSIRKEELTQRWVSVDPAIKFQIKESLLRTLGSPVAEARHTSSQVTAKVASIEIPRREWQELIAKLLTYMTQQDTTSSLKQATLEALGYVCEEVSPQDLQQDQVNAVLTAVVQGMNQRSIAPKSPSAVKALYNALDFAQTNFENELERAFIIKVVCETAEPVALQAIEFWSTVCDEEIAIQEDSSLITLHRKGSSIARTYAVDCLGLVARTVGDAVVPLVMPFVQENIMKADCTTLFCHEEAMLAIGALAYAT
ncbi:Importin subunit beta-1, partial [Ananas comosus]